MQKPEFTLKESICHEIKDGFYNEKKVAMTCYLVYCNISKNDILYNMVQLETVSVFFKDFLFCTNI